MQIQAILFMRFISGLDWFVNEDQIWSTQFVYWIGHICNVQWTLFVCSTSYCERFQNAHQSAKLARSSVQTAELKRPPVSEVLSQNGFPADFRYQAIELNTRLGHQVDGNFCSLTWQRTVQRRTHFAFHKNHKIEPSYSTYWVFYTEYFILGIFLDFPHTKDQLNCDSHIP